MTVTGILAKYILNSLKVKKNYFLKSIRKGNIEKKSYYLRVGVPWISSEFSDVVQCF